MTRIRSILVVLCVLTVSASAFAQGGPPPGGGPGPGGRGGPRGPDHPPGRPRPDRDRDRENSPDALDDLRPRPQRMGPEAQRELDAFWEDNKQKIIDFCKEHSPNRWRAYERRIGQVNDYRAPRIPLLMQLKHLMELEKTDPELYKIKVAQIWVEDKQYPLAREVNRNREGGGDSTSARNDLRKLALEAVMLRLDERQLRLSRLQKRLEAEQQRLAKERENPEALVDAHVEEVIRTPPGPAPLRRPQSTTSQPGTGAPN